MTNLQEAANPDASRLQQRLLLGIPVGIGAVATALIVGFAVVPRWLGLQAASERLAQLEELKARIPTLRAQIAKIGDAQSKAERNQIQLFQLIQGSGELATFLAQLDREATRLGVQLDLFEPVVAPPAPPANAKNETNKGDQAPPPPSSPMEAAGLQAQKVLITAKGSFPNLLAFLRATEMLSVLVTQSNLSLTAEDPSKQAPATTAQPGATKPLVAQSVAKTELKLMLTSYQTADPKVTPLAVKKP